jgi:polyhydroxyalkanoate synthesis regulator phasin
MENQTIKLSKALQDLIKAYEVLQNENTKLQEEVSSLKEDKANLEQRVIELEDFSTKQTTDVSDMLSKIENILGECEDEKEVEVAQNVEITTPEPILTASLETKPAMQNLVNSIETQEEEIEEKIDEDKLKEFMNNIPMQ